MPPVQPNMQPNMYPGMQPGMNPGLMQRAEASLNAKANKQFDFIKTIVIVVLSLIAVTFIGLFIWILVQYNSVSEDVNGKIQAAVDKAVIEQKAEDETKYKNELSEKLKDPYLDFVGPVDYGSLSFKYPRTWSLYIKSDASSGGDYEAFFNPWQVNPISKNTVNALRLTIKNKDFESVAAEYQKVIDRGRTDLTVETVEIGGVLANRYKGQIPDSSLKGQIVIFKIRDKTAILQMDSEEFLEEFNKLLETIGFNA